MAKTLKISGGDWFFDINGKSQYITGIQKTAQDIAEYILKEPGIDTSKSIAEVESKIYSAMNRLRSAQANNPEVTSDEMIKEISEFIVVPNPEDPKNSAFFLLSAMTEGDFKVTRLFDQSTLTDLSHILPEDFDTYLEEDFVADILKV